MSELEVEIREEATDDRERVREIVAAAFAQQAEADLVDRMRGRVSPEISLVAVVGDGIVGHIYFSPVRVGDDARPALALGPVAVDPACQRRAVGSTLCRRGLERCLAIGEPVVFVLGHADYYPRFGFELASARGLYYRSEAFASHFFVAELRADALRGYEGEVCYDEAFDEF